jgi:4-amino-4-deoxy-L-arabinose transferase-like glycosyltransferase
MQNFLKYPGFFKKNIPIWVLLVIGILVLFLKIAIIYPVYHIGHNDSMGYAEMADSIIHGRGLAVDYVSFHFIKYDTIPHPEDHWPPLYSLLIVPFYLIFGKIALAFKFPSLIISSILLPIGTYYLAKKLSTSEWIGLLSGLTIIFSPNLFFWSLFCLSDVTYVFIFLMVILFAIKGFDDKKYFYLMGIFIGLGYYTKGSAILLIPSVIIFYFVKTLKLKAIFRDKSFAIGLAIAIIIMVPFWIRNYIQFKNPLHSTQNYWSGNIGYSTDGPSNGNTYKVYWDKTKPSWTATKLPLGLSFIAEKTWEYLDTQFQWAFVNMGPIEQLTPKSVLYFKPVRSVFKEFPQFPNGIPIGILGFPALLGMIFLWRNRNIYIIPIAFGIILLFLSITWAPIDRLILISIPLVISLGWTSYYRFLIKCLSWIPYKRKWVSIMLKGIPIFFTFLLTLAIVVYSARADYKSWQNGKGGNPQTRFKITVDEVRIYKRALTADEVKQNYQVKSTFASKNKVDFSTKGLISYWSFDRDIRKDNIIRDVWGQNNGIAIGIPNIVDGKVGNALYFDGDDCVQIPATQSLNLSDAFTIEAWVKGDKSPNNSEKITQWLSKGNNYVFSWDHSKDYMQSIAFFNEKKVWPVAKIKGTINGGEWYHVVSTWDGNVLKIYLNGRLSNESISDSLPLADDVPLRIGDVAFNGGWFPYADGTFEREQILLAQWIKENTSEDAVIMDCDPWALQFYSDRRTVHFACDTVEEIFRVMRHYGVSYITYDVYEEAHPKTLDNFYQGKTPGFELVYSISSALKLYKVHYELLSPALMQDD